MPTNTFRYTMCSTPNVYMFVYTLIGAHIVPLIHLFLPTHVSVVLRGSYGKQRIIYEDAFHFIFNT